MNASIVKPPSDEPFIPFLRKALKTNHFQVYPLAGDASNRRYFRVVVDDASWVLMVWEPFVDDDNYPFLSVQRHFLKAGISVPRVVEKSPSEGLVLLEDLGDLTLERKFWESQNPEIIVPYYEATLDEVAKIHYKASREKSGCTAFKVAFDTEKLLWEMNYGRTHLIEGISGIKPTSAEDKALADTFLKICETLDREPRYIAHRDYHSRNVMIKFGNVRVIDFQDARMGAIQYDLVSLLKDTYVNLDESITNRLLNFYLEKRIEYGEAPVNRDHFDHIYEVQSIQRCFKACGSFASFYQLRKDTRYLKYLKPTLQRVKHSLSKFPEYAVFASILEDHGLYEDDFLRT